MPEGWDTIFLFHLGSVCSIKILLFSEVASVLRDKYDGSAWRLLQKADKSAQKLLTLVTQDFPCFRDEASLDDGTRVAIYKRAQIFIADLHSLFEGQGLAEFKDIDTLTMFGDYRVPQSLQYFAVFSYSPVSCNPSSWLALQIHCFTSGVAPGSEEE